MEVSSAYFHLVLLDCPGRFVSGWEHAGNLQRGGWMVSRAGHEKLERGLLLLPAVYTVFSVV